jgi:NAD(P)-dependent dehydrogenase (short-subunit alcohol dehydrogenase family)
MALPLDVADANAMEEAAASVEREFGPIDVWVNNAMASVFSPVKENAAGGRHRSHLPRRGIWNPGRFETDVAARSWDHRSGGIGATGATKE